ncbi:MAG: hypothetical protein FJ088_05225 [Deltaproteobacteria bacterium]|nr:hypothetical protein [Deltaproteobacteria bacterium]
MALISFSVSCGGGAGTKITINGFVVDSSNAPLSNVAIIYNGSKIGGTVADGKFSVEFGVSDADDPENVALIIFERGGYSRGFKQIKTSGGALFSFRVKLKNIGNEKTADVPEGDKKTLVKADNVMIQFGSGVLVDEDENPVTGNVSFNIASFDTFLYDFLTPPVFHHIKSSAGAALPSLRVLAMGDFRMIQNDALVYVAEGKSLELYLRTSPFNFISASDDRIFRLDEETGYLVEFAGERTVDTGQNQIKALVSLPGLYVWAKELSDTACLDIDLKVDGSGKSKNSSVELTGIGFKDEVNAPSEGFYCVNGAKSSAVTLDVITVSETGNAFADQFSEILPSAQSSCQTGGCKQISYTIPCLADGDCAEGQKCVELRCNPPL